MARSSRSGPPAFEPTPDWLTLTSTTTAPATSETPRRPSRSSSGSTLGRYILIRALLIIPTVFILVTLVFVLMRTTGDPITAALGGRLSADQLQERIHEAGFDRP